MTITNYLSYFTPLKIVDIHDSGNNGIIFKALEYGKTRALKVLYGFSVDSGVLGQKARAEYAVTQDLAGIKGIPQVHKLYEGKKGVVEPFSATGFNFQKAKKQIMSNRDSFQSDSESDLVLAGAFTMDFMDFFHKLPKESQQINYDLPKHFFQELRDIGNEMLKRGYSLPPESDIGFDKYLRPIVVDFASCKSIAELVSSGKSPSAAKNYIKNYNSLKIRSLQDQYMDKKND